MPIFPAGRARLLVAALALAVLPTAPTATLAASWKAPVPPGMIPGAPVVEAQSSAQMAEQSMRIDRAEQQMRELNGRIEELTFQIRQLQEMIRRMQEDTEFRFQELEGGAPPQRRSEAPAPAPVPGGDVAVAPDIGMPPPATAPTDLGNGFSIDAPSDLGAPPQVLGQVPADAPPAGTGAVTGGPLDLSAIARGEDPTAPAADPGLPGLPPDPGLATVGPADGALPPPPDADPIGQQVAVLVEDPRAQYERAYGFIVAGDYRLAEQGFRQFLSDNSGSPLAGDAHFWLGESLYAQGEFRDAADSFLATYRDYPASAKAPDSLLKLGLSLEGLGEKDAACATYRELQKKFPSAPAALLRQVESQQSRSGC